MIANESDWLPTPPNYFHQSIDKFETPAYLSLNLFRRWWLRCARRRTRPWSRPRHGLQLQLLSAHRVGDHATNPNVEW